MHVAEIARQQIGHDLPVAFGGEFVPAGKAFQDQMDGSGLFVFPCQIDMGIDGSDIADDGIEQPLVIRTQRGVSLKLPDKSIVHCSETPALRGFITAQVRDVHTARSRISF